MKNSYHKTLVPLRRVTYYKHVKFDLRDNITSRDVTKKVRIWREPAARTRCSGNSSQNPVLKTFRNGYLDLSLRRTRKKKSWYWSMNLTRLSDFLQNPTESKSRRMLSKSLVGRDPGTCELCLFVLLIRIAYLVVFCFCFGRESHFMRDFSDLKEILRVSSIFTLGGVLKKTKELIHW